MSNVDPQAILEAELDRLRKSESSMLSKVHELSQNISDYNSRINKVRANIDIMTTALTKLRV